VNDVVTRAAHAACRLTPSAVLHRMMNIDVIVLAYHVVSDDIVPHVAHLYPYKTPARFELDLEYLNANYHILSFEEFEKGCRGRARRKPGVLLTFDDGLSECYDIVRPILLRLGIPCTFFVATSFIDNRSLFYRHKASLCVDRIKKNGRDTEDDFTQWIMSLRHADEDTIESVCETLDVDPGKFLRERQPYLTTGQLEQLVADGFTLGGHGKQHVELVELRDPALIEAEIVESCEHVRRLTRTTRVPFAFPFTGRRVSRGFLQDLVSRNTSVSFFFDTAGFAADAPFVVNRIGADGPVPLPDLLRYTLEHEGAGRAAAWMRRLSR